MNHKCQVFTPNEYVVKMLDMSNYSNNLFGKKVLENSFGDGNFLSEIIRRYIEDCIVNNIELDRIKDGLQNDIYGFEIDEEQYEKCLIRLEKITNQYGIKDVHFVHLIRGDYLNSQTIKFDYIIGNPPYISHRDLSKSQRDELKEKFVSCQKGKFDFCYPFIEKSINDLNDSGIFTYIIPNSIFKNVFGETIRRMLIDNGLKSITDNFDKKVFIKATVCPAIFTCEKKYNDDVLYFNSLNNKVLISRDNLRNSYKWMFEKKYTPTNEFSLSGNVSIGNSIATLANAVFLIKNVKSIDKKYIYFDEFKIEKSILRKACSPHSLKRGIKEYIIFPYYFDNDGVLRRYEEEDFIKKFPFAYKYLLSKKNVLEKRDSDYSAKWYEYGRSQALKNMNKLKIMISILYTKEIKVYLLDNETIPYSGIYIALDNLEDYLKIEKLLLEDNFIEYIKSVGIKSEGKSYRITSNDLKDYIYGGSKWRH